MAWVNPTEYRIVVTGELGRPYAGTFEPLQLIDRDGETEIVGRIEDDAELQGLLDAVAALGLSLVSVSPVMSGELGGDARQALAGSLRPGRRRSARSSAASRCFRRPARG